MGSRAWMVPLAAWLAATACAQGLETLHDFTGVEGRRPYSSLIEGPGGALFGTTAYGGAANGGTVFRIERDGTGYGVLHDFAQRNDGVRVYNSLAVVGTHLYGVAWAGGANGAGTLYRVDAAGGGFQVAHHFGGSATPSNGGLPYSAPVAVGHRLFGMTSGGGINGLGSVYMFDTTSETYSTLHSFSAGDGTKPFGALTPVGEWLYGTTSDLASTTSAGTIFRMRQDGTAFEVVHRFAGGAQGGYPQDSLAFDGVGTLYGTTFGSGTGSQDQGVVFKYDLSASSYQVLHDFASSSFDGARPSGSLVVVPGGSTLYGVSQGTGTAVGLEPGTLFQVATDGTGFQVLHTFTGLEQGDTPLRTPILVDSTLYGVSIFGGPSQTDDAKGYGKIWSVTVPEPSLPALLSVAVAGVLAGRMVIRRGVRR